MHVKNYINSIYGTFEANYFFTSLYSLQKGKIWCIHAIQCVYVVQKTHYFPHSVHYCCSFMLCLSETHTFFTKLIVLRSEVCSDWPDIQCILIGRIPQACDGNVMPITMLWCHVETKTIKPTINEAFVAFSEDIITYYNDSYAFKSLRSHSRNAKQALLFTAQNSCLISQ